MQIKTFLTVTSENIFLDVVHYRHYRSFKGIVHLSLAYLKGIQDVGVFVSTVFSILTFFIQTVVIHWRLRGSTKKHAQRSQN